MMKSAIKKISEYLLLVPAVVLGLSFAVPVTVGAAAVDCTTDTASMTIEGGAGCTRSDSNNTPTDLFGTGGIFQTIVNIMLFLVGAIAVIMLIVGGIRYITSNGNQEQVTGAKNTIMYSIVGIIVAILAYAIVNFVVTGLNKT